MEVRWCLAHKGVESNEKADDWAKLAADEPDDYKWNGSRWATSHALCRARHHWHTCHDESQ